MISIGFSHGEEKKRPRKTFFLTLKAEKNTHAEPSGAQP
jgi:hypothetical protein